MEDVIIPLIPVALASGAVVQIIKEAKWASTTWVLRTIAIASGGILGFLSMGDVVAGMAAGGMATTVFAAVKRKLAGTPNA